MDEAGRSSVLVDNVTLGDAGTYVCVAENIVGSIRALSFVRIRGETSARTRWRNFLQTSSLSQHVCVCVQSLQY